MTKSVHKALRGLLLDLLPEADWVDNAIAFGEFVRAHRRLPRRGRYLFNDVLYQIKTSAEIFDPLRMFVSDKEYVKTYVKAVAGDQFNVPTLSVLRSFNEVSKYRFPSTCCIKPTHLSGEVIIRVDSSDVDMSLIEDWFRRSHYRTTRERNYKHLRPKVIIEPVVFDNPNLTDYKIFCFQGRPKMIQLDLNRRQVHQRKFYDVDWNELPFSLGYPRSPALVPKPGNLDRMLGLAKDLSSPFDFIRVDLYSDSRTCLVGEITNCHGNAGERFIPKTSERDASDLIFESEFH
jgi:hypothetical protein